MSGGEGVEAYLIHKAKQAQKPMVGLVPLDEHIAVFGGMNDADSQTYLLLRFIQLDQESKTYERNVAEWKHGDIEGIEKSTIDDYTRRAVDPAAAAHGPQPALAARDRAVAPER